MLERFGPAFSLVACTSLVSLLGGHVPSTDAGAASKAHVVTLEPKAAPRVSTKQARPRTAAARPARLPASVRGQLRRGDATLQSGEYVDRIRVRFPVGEAVQLRLGSRAFDAYLIVRSPSGLEQQNDDMSSTVRDSGIDIAAAEEGEYTILVTSYQPGETGSYQLRYLRGQPPAPAATPGDSPGLANGATVPPPWTGPAMPGAPSGGSTDDGELADGDARLRSGEFYDTYRRTVAAGQALRIRLESTAFDPYLIVRTPSGRQMDADDTTPQDRNATVEIAATEAGTYTVMVTSYAPAERGRYLLRWSGGDRAPSPTAPDVRPDPSVPPPSNGAMLAAAPNGGRVFGVFGGISDYPGTANDLADCAEDAVKLAQALRRANLMTEAQQIVLTDAQMTTSAVRSAMQRMAQQVGPDDIFVFFYSGHGGRTSGSRDTRELYGVDETIALYDGAIVDDEMGRLFDTIRGRLAMLTLDSCYSGGFAKDVITTTGRVGFFSSAEDVESAVASEFQAGGYLSYFLREGISGAADTSPRDSVLTVGELEHYLINQFGQHATNVAMSGAFQHLVSDRGAVRSDQQLWTFR